MQTKKKVSLIDGAQHNLPINKEIIIKLDPPQWSRLVTVDHERENKKRAPYARYKSIPDKKISPPSTVLFFYY
jgi:hypothetical protein